MDGRPTLVTSSRPSSFRGYGWTMASACGRVGVGSSIPSALRSSRPPRGGRWRRRSSHHQMSLTCVPCPPRPVDRRRHRRRRSTCPRASVQAPRAHRPARASRFPILRPPLAVVGSGLLACMTLIRRAAVVEASRRSKPLSNWAAARRCAAVRRRALSPPMVATLRATPRSRRPSGRRPKRRRRRALRRLRRPRRLRPRRQRPPQTVQRRRRRWVRRSEVWRRRCARLSNSRSSRQAASPSRQIRSPRSRLRQQ
mmetsp:Transcript_37283/g.98637  ORF Transcript_37283/g.98637 Transcript_37283/m.98637 type:complete len:254 (-) Transcript_37283:427-1188(-)